MSDIFLMLGSFLGCDGVGFKPVSVFDYKDTCLDPFLRFTGELAGA